MRQEPPSLVNYIYDYLSSFYDVLLMASSCRSWCIFC